VGGNFGACRSETFLDFAAPLLGEPGGATKDQLEEVLKVGFTVWNSVVFDTVNGNTECVATLRKLTAVDPISAALTEQMISRKRAVFPDDHRLIGRYGLKRKNGEWRLWAEARAPATGE